MPKWKAWGILVLMASSVIFSAESAIADWVDNIPWGASPSVFEGKTILIEASEDGEEFYRDIGEGQFFNSVELGAINYVFSANQLIAVMANLKNGMDFDNLKKTLEKKYGMHDQQKGNKFFWERDSILVLLDKTSKHCLVLADRGQVDQKPKSSPESSLQFSHHNVSYSSDTFGTEIIGELTNNSGVNYKIASFSISLYSKDGDLIDVVHFIINNFQRGQTRSFTATSLKIAPKGVRFKIQLESGL